MMKYCVKFGVLVAVVFFAALCIQAVPRKVQSNVGESIDAMTQQLWELKKSNAEMREKLEAMAVQIDDSCGTSQRTNADLVSKIDDVTQQLLVLSEKLGDVNYRLAMMASTSRPSAPMASPGRSEAPVMSKGSVTRVTSEHAAVTIGNGGGRTPDAPPPVSFAPTTAPEKIYQNAYADYSRGNYSLAVMGFQDYATRFPDTELSDNALYWVGECFYAEKDFEQAVIAFEKMIKEYPGGDKVPGAFLKKGYAYLEIHQVGQGVVQLQGLIQKYPLSREARLAKQKLEELGLTSR